MKIDFSTQGRVAFDMIPYITKIIGAFPEKITGIASSLAADYLFTSVLHLMQNFYLSFKLVCTITPCHNFFFRSCVRCDIQTTVAFLTTHVKAPDEDDSSKLKWVLKYLSSTRHLCLTLFADNLTDIKWYVDASH
jgi:hypothetical protein